VFRRKEARKKAKRARIRKRAFKRQNGLARSPEAVFETTLHQAIHIYSGQISTLVTALRTNRPCHTIPP